MNLSNNDPVFEVMMVQLVVKFQSTEHCVLLALGRETGVEQRQYFLSTLFLVGSEMS